MPVWQSGVCLLRFVYIFKERDVLMPKTRSTMYSHESCGSTGDDARYKGGNWFSEKKN